MRHRTLIACVGTALLAACGMPSREPRIMSVSPGMVYEGQSRALDVRVDGLGALPSFDLDRGQGAADLSVRISLEPGARVLATRRLDDEHFSAMVTDTVPPGRYDVVLNALDGRTARLNGGLRVAGNALIIETIATDRDYVASDATAVPLYITLRNTGACTLRNVTVVPRFLRDETDVTGVQLIAHATSGTPTIPPQSPMTMAFRVEMLAGVNDGEIVLDATASGERTSEVGCQDTVIAPFANQTARWVITSRMVRDLVVRDLVRHQQPQVGNRSINMTFQLFNPSDQAVRLDQLRFDAAPGVVTLMEPPAINPRTLEPHTGATYGLFAVLGEQLRARAVVTLAVFASGYDSTGVIHMTDPAAPAERVTINE